MEKEEGRKKEKQKSVKLHIMTRTQKPAHRMLLEKREENTKALKMEACTHSYLSGAYMVRGGLKCFLHAHSHFRSFGSDNVKLKWTHNHMITPRYRCRQFLLHLLLKAQVILHAFDFMLQQRELVLVSLCILYLCSRMKCFGKTVWGQSLPSCILYILHTFDNKKRT